MPYANYYVLESLLGRLECVSPAEEQRILAVDADDEIAVREVFRNHLVPDFQQFTEDSQLKCKESLSYFLTTKSAPFEEILDGLQEVPLGPPSDPITLFRWLWDELFPGQDFQIDASQGWIVENDAFKASLAWRKANQG